MVFVDSFILVISCALATHFVSLSYVSFAEKRDFFDASLRKKVSAALVSRTSMQPNVRLDGPAMIIEDETATIVTSGFTAIGQDDGSLLLLRKETAQ